MSTRVGCRSKSKMSKMSKMSKLKPIEAEAAGRQDRLLYRAIMTDMRWAMKGSSNINNSSSIKERNTATGEVIPKIIGMLIVVIILLEVGCLVT